jgi:predicted PurR-regulated permease PerM
MLISLDLGLKLGGALGLVIAVPIASFIKATFDTIRASRSDPQLVLVPGETASSSEPSSNPMMEETMKD